MNHVAIFKNNVGSLDRDKKLLNFRYKLHKLLSLVPNRERQLASAFEESDLRNRFYRELWSRSASNLGYQYTELGQGFWRVTNDSGDKVWGRVGAIGLDSNVTLKLAGNKPLCHRILADVSGYHAPRFCEFRLADVERAREFMALQRGPCVVKPAADTGAGAGVTTGIQSDAALNRAAIAASVLCKDLLIEETIAGSSYRLLFLDGEYLHGVRRDPPQLIGDGELTIKELIHAENRRRQQASSIESLFPISIDQDCRTMLKTQGWHLGNKPGKGQTMTVKQVVNENAAKENIDITDQVHPSIVSTGARASARLGLRLTGVDILTSDISRPLSDAGGVINEVNGTPGLHHHYLTAQNRDPAIAEKLLQRCMAGLN